MKVLLINNFFYRRGGSEAVFFNTADLLKEAGHEVVFFSFIRDENLPCKDEIYFVECERKIKQFLNFFSNSEAARKLDILLSVEKPDIAHVHLFWGGLSPSIIGVLHKHGVPLVHTAHDYRMVCPAYTFKNGRGEVCEKCKGGHFLQCMKNRCSKGSLVNSAIMTAEMYYRNKKWHPAKEMDGIIFVSYFSKWKHEEMDPLFASANSMVLYNCSDFGSKYPPIEKDGGYYLYYGRLSSEKGIDTLLEAFAMHPELTLKVVGTGPLKEELENKYSCTKGSSSRVDKCYKNIQFLGYCSGQTLAELVRNAKFVCVPSECYENNPMTIVESYSMGVPVIGANIGGIPEIVEDGMTGFLFESGSSESLEQAIVKSLAIRDDNYLTMKQVAKQYAENHFDNKTYVDKLVSFYNSILVKRKLIRSI